MEGARLRLAQQGCQPGDPVRVPHLLRGQLDLGVLQEGMGFEPSPTCCLENQCRDGRATRK
jgi:hypothetical protein